MAEDVLLSLEEAKLWLRVDYDEEDSLIQTLIDAAERYLFDATGRKWTGGAPTAKLCAMALVADWYENRDAVTDKPSEKTRFTVQSMILQLQNTPADEDGDDDGD